MSTRERRPVEAIGPLPAGAYRAVCLGVTPAISKAGNAMNVWAFNVEGRTLNRYCTTKGPGGAATYETAMALGLGQRSTRAQAVGRECMVEVEVDGQFNSITRCKPLQ